MKTKLLSVAALVLCLAGLGGCCWHPPCGGGGSGGGGSTMISPAQQHGVFDSRTV